MAAYAYPIIIKPEKQVVKYSRQINLPDEPLSLSLLRDYVTEDDTFTITENDWSIYPVLTIFKTRLETDKEQQERVNKETAYTVEYNKRHPQKQ